MFKPSNKKYININTLKKLSEKYNWIFIISTNKGIMTSIEASNLKIGGLLIAKIWN
jgi:ribosomal protein S8